MILEQRYGAAQVVVRATSVLLQHADTIQTTSADEFRRDIFRVGWNFISERHAMAALVNMVSTVQWALDDVSDVRDMHRILPRVVADIRHQLNQRVLDTAAHSLAFLSNTQHIITYGYSTTVQYALQHALRNGHRVHVTCVNTPMAYEVTALAERIAAIGISVAVEDMHTLDRSMSQYDALMVGADTLDMHGLTNKRGTATLVDYAVASGIPVYTLCTSEKLLANDFFLGHQQQWPLDDVAHKASNLLPSENDITALERITSIITDRGALPSPAIDAWLARVELHPWLCGRGTL
ncbi:MAG: hypothetical protein ACK46D_05495 [Roseiflexaceae bacterium]|jgi:translation initiation factor 2B subunit (eIF-2B alpha/beta/delta family)|nr:hypothetical protein [Chloroflexaceae bacterium]